MSDDLKPVSLDGIAAAMEQKYNPEQPTEETTSSLTTEQAEETTETKTPTTETTEAPQETTTEAPVEATTAVTEDTTPKPIEWNEEIEALAKSKGWAEQAQTIEDSELIKKIRAFESQGDGITAKRFAEMLLEKEVDYTAYNTADTKQAEELITKALKQKNSDYTSVDVQDYLEDNFPLLYESYTKSPDDFDTDSAYEADKQRWNNQRDKEMRRFTRAAKDALNELKANQASIELPKGGETAEQKAQREQQTQAAIQAYQQYAASKVAAFDKVEITVGDETTSIEVDEGVKSRISGTLLDLNSFFLSDDPNNPLKDDIMTKLAWADDEFREAALKLRDEQIAAKSQLDVIEHQKNQKAPTAATTGETGDSYNLMDHIGRQVLDQSAKK
jgi:hypothetical protein